MISIKRILCPIDFSEFSRHALARAAGIARGQGAAITALHVVPIQQPVVMAPIEIGQPAPPGLTPDVQARLRRELATFVAGVSGGASIDTDVVEAPTVHGEILAQAGRLHVDLIVMGTHGRSGFQRLLLGSVTEKVLRTAQQPVLTVGAFMQERDASLFKRILCAIDFSDCSLAALQYALALAEGAGADVTAVNVVEWTPVGYDPLTGPMTDLAGYRMEAEASSRERLHEAVDKADSRRVQVREIVSSGKPHHEILRIAAEDESDLIVLGIHGRNPVDRMLFGSTAEPVVRRASCPVLTVRAEPGANVAAA